MRSRLDVLGVVAAGGIAGSLARYAATVVVGASPLVTFAVNVLGCLMIGMLTGLMSEAWAGRRLLRPFLGTGVLGGFTTFSGYAIDAQQLLTAGRFVVAVVYLGGTLVAALVAVSIGTALTRASLNARRRHARSYYRLAEPLITFHHAITRPEWSQSVCRWWTATQARFTGGSLRVPPAAAVSCPPAPAAQGHQQTITDRLRPPPISRDQPSRRTGRGWRRRAPAGGGRAGRRAGSDGRSGSAAGCRPVPSAGRPRRRWRRVRRRRAAAPGRWGRRCRR